MNTSGDGFGGHLRGYFGWVWVETFLISLFLFLMLFLFINREMMFAVVAVTTTVALLLALAGWLFKLEGRSARAAVSPKLLRALAGWRSVSGNAEHRRPNQFRLTHRGTDNEPPTDEWRHIAPSPDTPAA